MPKVAQLIPIAIAAGCAIGLAGYIYLTLHDIAGAILFSFGLLTIVNYKLKLFTSVAGFIHRNELPQLALILGFNAIGCILVGLLTRVAAHPLNETAQQIIGERLANGSLNSGLLAIGCGVIMTISVTFAYRGNIIPLLFGVPIFIKCGFPHCMADTFYLSSCSTAYLMEHAGQISTYYPAIILGNFVGCNLPRLFPKPWDEVSH
ncbi:formate/nitrite transporter family protein [Porphyromonas loveana]